MLLTTFFTNAQIPIQGFFEDHEGSAVWDADGSGPEPEAYGHIHPFGYGPSGYYAASRDYDGIDPDPKAAMCHFMNGITGFPLLIQALVDNGFTPGQLKIKYGMGTLKDDIEGEDWFTFNNAHYVNRYDSYYTIVLNNEPVISCYNNYMQVHIDSLDDFWVIETNFSYPEDISGFSSPPVQDVAAAFMADMNGQQMRLVVDDLQFTGEFFDGNGRVDGAFFDIVSGYLEKGWPELPIAGSVGDHQGLALWDADGTGPEPEAYGHTFYYGGNTWWTPYYTASLDYDGIDPDPNAAIGQKTGVATAFPNLELQMAYRGFSPDQLKIKSSIATLGNDIEGVDWWLDGNIHYSRSFGNKVIFEIAGEPILEYSIDSNFSSMDLDNLNGELLSYSNFSPVKDISADASEDAQFVAKSLLKDMGGQFIQSVLEGTFVDYFNDGNGRDGVFYQVDYGYFTLGSGQGTFIEGGDVSGNWLAENSPYMINGNIIVPDGETLTIEPGVIVAFRGPYYIRVEGCVIAEGTDEENILFTHSNPTVLWDGFDYEDTPSSNDSSRFSYCTFQYAYAQSPDPLNSGGAFGVKNFDKLKITNCTFQHNLADQMGPIHFPTGGAIALWNSSPLIQNCIFRHNYAETFGGAIFLFEYSNPVISGCLFYDNESGSLAGAIGFDENSTGILINNTIIYNFAEYGGALAFLNGSSPEVVNNIIWGNIAELSGNQVHIENSTNNPGFYYCDIEEGQEGFGGVTVTIDYLFNLDKDPLFSTNPDDPVYYLTSESPCINMGTPDTSAWFYPQYLPNTCLGGNPRIYEDIIDMGVYEVMPVGIGEEIVKLDEFRIQPNPFRNTIQIVFELPDPEMVVLEIYNALGVKVASLEEGFFPGGMHNITWNTRGLPNGIYFCRLQAGEAFYTRKIIKN